MPLLATLMATFALLLPAAPAAAAPAGQLVVEVVAVDDSDYPAITAVVNVLDDAGRPVLGLTAGQMRAEEFGRHADVLAVERAVDSELSIAVVLAIDTSGSMSGGGIEQARAAALAFLDSLAPGDQAAVVSFSNTVELVQPLTGDRDALRTAVSSLRASGNTALYQGVSDAIDRAAEATLSRKVVIILSDGEDYGGVSHVSREDALWKAALSGVTVYAIGLGAGIDQPFLEEITHTTQGGLLVAPTPDDVAATYALLAERLRSQYVVTLKSTAPAAGTARDLSVSIDTGVLAGSGALSYESMRDPAAIVATAVATGEATASATATAAARTTDGPQPPDGGTEDGAASSADGEGMALPTFALPLAGVAFVAVAGGFGLTRVRGRRRGRMANVRTGDIATHLPPRPMSGTTALPSICLDLAAGDAPRESFRIGRDPTIVGTGETSGIRLAAGKRDEVGEEHARFWWRDDTLMLQHLAPGLETLVQGQPVTLTSVRPGDVIRVGPHELHVVERDSAAPSPGPIAAEPFTD